MVAHQEPSSSIILPTICLQRATPEPPPSQGQEFVDTETNCDETKLLRTKPRLVQDLNPNSASQSMSRKRSATTPSLRSDHQDRIMVLGNVTRPAEEARMSEGSLSPTPTPPKKVKKGSKDADWADVIDPEQRRRIQNRIAQRKFREKTRENKERAERESRDHEHAGNSYRIPLAADVSLDDDLSGLPWGGVNLNLAVCRGHEVESRRSSGRGTFMGDEGQLLRPNGDLFQQSASYTSSGPEEGLHDDITYTTSIIQPAGFPSL